LATYTEALNDALQYYNGDDLPAKTFIDKYALRNGEEFLETTPPQMQERLAKELHRAEKAYINPRSYEEILDALLDFKYFSPQGSVMYGSGNPYAIVSLSNCFVVQPPEDTISSIVEQGKDMANIMKRRGGVGIDVSPLRPEKAPVNNAARTSTGAWSFADYYSYICRMIGQDGRRGALMISIDVRHPDVFKFATMKRDLSKVTGANVSIKINDEFMEAVRDDGNFTLQWPVDSKKPTVVREIKARDLWTEIIDSVHASAEPGLLMWDTMLRTLPAQCYADVGFDHVTTNPCGEIILSPEDACRLLAMNLTGFVVNKFTDKAKFNFKLFREKAHLAQRMMDNIIDLELECVEEIINSVSDPSEKKLWKKIYKRGSEGRRTGLGTFGLADTMSQLGILYGSQESLDFADKVYKDLRNSSYEESVNMAEERGIFPVWDWKKEKDNVFIKALPPALVKRIAKSGRRNISNLTNAPTGSLSIVAGNLSSGIEPVFRTSYKRRKKLNHGDENAKVDFIDQLGDKWQEFNVFHKNVRDYLEQHVPDWDGHTLPELPDYFVSSDELDWENRVKLQGTIQKYIDHSISSTINLPADVEKSTVSKLYLKAWEEGLKGVTIYVDGSRTGVLVSENTNKDHKGRPPKVTRTHAPKRPPVVPCDIYHGKVQGELWTIVVGLLAGEPYELFGGPSEDAEIPKGAKSGYITKTKVAKGKNRYDLSYSHYKNEVIVADIGNTFENKTFSTTTRLLSLSLRHGAPVQHIVEQLGKDESEELFSLSSILRRALKKYIVDGTIVSGTKKGCDKCGSSNLRYQEGCPVCLDCGFTKCK
jgi:ribonucleoside-diphosphate reductase alpha chain